MVPNGYNIRSGGSKGKHCEESKERMRQSKLGEKNFNYGKPRTDECKKNISIAKSGENHHFYGKSLSDDHKLKLSAKKSDTTLPMYVCIISPRKHSVGGYAVDNHPFLKTKWFTSKKFTLEERLKLALEYLNSYKKE
jgi:hypothetical protein